jgi:nicotinate phosphoribosyltransferase
MTRGDGMFTDLYELTMLQAYFNEGMVQDAVFELFIRAMPPGRNFLVACGLEQVLEYLEHLHFSQESLAYLESLGLFTAPFLEYLEAFRFTGDVRAVPEGTAVFPTEPLLEVEAPLPQAQLVETFVLNQITFQTMIASKGARAVLLAGGKTLVDFGSRRAHGTDAGLKAARALYLAGYAATSNVLAGRQFGIPVSGTMAHSYIQAHDSELEAFERFIESFPEAVLLVDTYDTDTGVQRAAEAALGSAHPIRGVRLDSGDLATLAREARRILDEAGLQDVSIFASGGLDEEEIAALLAAGAPIDAFGVGTSAVVSTDSPALDSVYKLVSYAGKPRLKLSPEKATLPGRKQVWRVDDGGGTMRGDTIALAGERLEGRPLLVEVMAQGRRTPAGSRSLSDVREHLRRELATLPAELRGLEPAKEPYPVALSAGLDAERRRVTAEYESLA